MRKWLRAGLVLALALSLFASVFGYSVASAKSPKPQDQVKNFVNAAAALKVDKAVSYWVTKEGNNVASELNSVPSGTKISLSKLKLVVTNQTTGTAEVNVTYNIKIKAKGAANVGKSNEKATFTLDNVNTTWLIASSDIWNNEPWKASAVTLTPTATPTAVATLTQGIPGNTTTWTTIEGAASGIITITPTSGTAVTLAMPTDRVTAFYRSSGTTNVLGDLMVKVSQPTQGTPGTPPSRNVTRIEGTASGTITITPTSGTALTWLLTNTVTAFYSISDTTNVLQWLMNESVYPQPLPRQDYRGPW